MRENFLKNGGETRMKLENSNSFELRNTRQRKKRLRWKISLSVTREHFRKVRSLRVIYIRIRRQSEKSILGHSLTRKLFQNTVAGSEKTDSFRNSFRSDNARPFSFPLFFSFRIWYIFTQIVFLFIYRYVAGKMRLVGCAAIFRLFVRREDLVFEWMASRI